MEKISLKRYYLFAKRKLRKSVSLGQREFECEFEVVNTVSKIPWTLFTWHAKGVMDGNDDEYLEFGLLADYLSLGCELGDEVCFEDQVGGSGSIPVLEWMGDSSKPGLVNVTDFREWRCMIISVEQKDEETGEEKWSSLF